jgi:hypothetical protein
MHSSSYLAPIGNYLSEAAKPCFTGVVAGLDVNEAASISLSHIPYTDNPTLSFDSSTGVVTVTDAHAGKTVTINTVMTPGIEGGRFFITPGSDGSTLIVGGAG